MPKLKKTTFRIRTITGYAKWKNKLPRLTIEHDDEDYIWEWGIGDYDEDDMWDECLNCGSIWGPGSEEWQFQQCDACGWHPGKPTDDEWEFDDDDDNDYDRWEEEGWE